MRTHLASWAEGYIDICNLMLKGISEKYAVDGIHLFMHLVAAFVGTHLRRKTKTLLSKGFVHTIPQRMLRTIFMSVPLNNKNCRYSIQSGCSVAPRVKHVEPKLHKRHIRMVSTWEPLYWNFVVSPILHQNRRYILELGARFGYMSSANRSQAIVREMARQEERVSAYRRKSPQVAWTIPSTTDLFVHSTLTNKSSRHFL